MKFNLCIVGRDMDKVKGEERKQKKLQKKKNKNRKKKIHHRLPEPSTENGKKEKL